MPRLKDHDYHSTCAYYIVLKKGENLPPLSRVVGTGASVGLECSPTGRIVAYVLGQLSAIEPRLLLRQYCVMPDHVHMLVEVTDCIPSPLGDYIARLKDRIQELVAQQLGRYRMLFEKDFHDCILTPEHDVDAISRYILDNPRRVAVRQGTPDFYSRVYSLNINGVPCEAYGNLHLLRHPFKVAAVVHRAASPDQLEEKFTLWGYVAGNGGVIVSPFISPLEREVHRIVEEANCKIILIVHRPFTDSFTPSEHYAKLCAQGRLLILSIHSPSQSLSRSLCLRMNALAEFIATTVR